MGAKGTTYGLIMVALLAATLAIVPAPDASASSGPLTFTRHTPPYGLPNAAAAAEPTIGIDWRTGVLMYQAFSSTYAVTFDDLANPPVATWLDRTSPAAIVNTDPILFTDSSTGRTFAGGLDGACSVLAFTDDDGLTWAPMGNSCSGGVDHPSIASGPWTQDRPVTARSPRAVYYCAQASLVHCAVSGDGGLTFGPGVTVTCGFFNPGLHGSITVGANGWAYLPFRTCGGWNGMAVTKDNGLTWQARHPTYATPPPVGFDPDVGTTTSGHAYFAYPTADWGVGVASTPDGGITWNEFGDVAGPAGVRSSTFHEMLAGDDDRAAVAFLGSTTDGNPHAEGFAGNWYVYVSMTLDAGETWTTVRASDNIVHRGWICTDGPTCTGARNLLDFMDAQLTREGRIVIGYADGCTGACELGYGTSVGAFASILRQAGGTSLLRDADTSEPGKSMGSLVPELPTATFPNGGV